MQTVYYALGSLAIIGGGVWGVVKAALWVGRKFGNIEAQLTLITENHLSHIYEELKYLRERVG